MSKTRAEVEIDGTTRELARARAYLERVQRQNDALGNRLLEAEQAVAANNRTLEEERAELAARDLQLAALENALATRESELRALEERLAADEADTKGIEERLAELEERDGREVAQQGRIRELEGYIAAREANIAALETQLSVLVSSESWRLTEPLRALGRAARRVMPAPRKVSRWRSSPAQLTSDVRRGAASSGRARIVFVSGEPDTPGHRYRVTSVASALAPQFFEAVVVRLEELPERLDELVSADVLWIWRASHSEALASATEAARAGGARIVYDVDDLMFRPELARAAVVDGIRTHNFSEGDVSLLFHAIRRALIEADHCTAPTATLARQMRALGKPTTVVPNGFDGALLRAAREARRRRQAAPETGVVRIGYAAGSFTHQRDLAVAVPALVRVLSEHPQARFVSFRAAIDIGEFPALQALAAQIELRPLVPLEQLPREYARFDINIAPLETGNPFCEAKSELKYFEAALAGTVSVASPTEPFIAAIRNGETGFLAADEQEWYELLSLLVRDPATRQRVADAAYRNVLWRFGPEHRSLLVSRLLNGFLTTPSVTADLNRASMNETSGALPQLDVPEYDVLYEERRAEESRIAVVVPVHNYAHLVEEALDSVRRQTVQDLDLVVVDDCSTDDSVEVVWRWLERHGSRFKHAALLRNRENSGLARTRNAGVEFADTELFLPLDPDNMLLPRCVEAALGRLDATGAAVVFPSVELFGESAGIAPSSDWDPMLLRGANYIDAMALVRRACWLAVGGYSRLDVDGWEDYDLWCKFVERGFFGTRAPDVLARYRVHSTSMLSTTTDLPENKARLIDEITRRHPWLDIALPAGRDGQGPVERLTGLMPGPVPADAHVVAAVGHSTPRADRRPELGHLLNILRCPSTGETLDWAQSDSVLVSTTSGREWPIVDGRPVFTPAGSAVTEHPDDHLSNTLPEEALRLFDETNGLVLNLSAGGTAVRYPNVIEVEYAIFRHTDVVADAHALPFADESFEAVVSLNAFEHYREPERAMSEVWRVLEPGGRLFLRTAFLQPMHEEPYHFYNCTKYGLERWLEEFEVEDLRVSDNFHPLYSLSWLASDLESGYAEVSAKTAAAFRQTPVEEFARFWREPDEQESETWRRFNGLPLRTREKAAAGWQVTARKPR